jgi:hypothetical protein
MMVAFSGDFALGFADGIRQIDLLGASGQSLSSQSGYVEIDKKMYRVVDITIPVIINDMFSQLGGGYDLGTVDNVREVDLLGANGSALSAQAAYVEIDHKMYRIMTLNIPIIINDMFSQLEPNFDFGGVCGVREIDLLGGSGQALNATAGYVEIDKLDYRVMTMNVPIVINDMFVQAS